VGAAMADGDVPDGTRPDGAVAGEAVAGTIQPVGEAAPYGG